MLYINIIGNTKINKRIPTEALGNREIKKERIKRELSSINIASVHKPLEKHLPANEK